MSHLTRPEWLDEKSADEYIRVYRVSTADDQFAAHGWRREHFSSEAEADLAEKTFASQGWTSILHIIDVPIDPTKLASFLNDLTRRGAA